MSTMTATAVGRRFDDGPDVVSDVHLSLRPGTLTTVAGAPDSGRTTLLRCLSGVYRPDRGQVVLASGTESVDLALADVRTLAWVRRHWLAVFDRALAAPPRQSAEQVTARAAGTSSAVAAEALLHLGLGAHTGTPVGRLRPAQQRTVALAAALWSGAPVVLLDDPETAAEPDAVREQVRVLLGRGAAVVATTPPTSSLEADATASAVLHEGKLRWTRQ